MTPRVPGSAGLLAAALVCTSPLTACLPGFNWKPSGPQEALSDLDGTYAIKGLVARQSGFHGSVTMPIAARVEFEAGTPRDMRRDDELCAQFSHSKLPEKVILQCDDLVVELKSSDKGIYAAVSATIEDPGVVRRCPDAISDLPGSRASCARQGSRGEDESLRGTGVAEVIRVTTGVDQRETPRTH